MSDEAATRPAALSFSQFSFSYATSNEVALHNLDFELEPGEFVLVTGSSGSGKSTLLKAACGLIPHFNGGELSGTVTVCGKDLRTHGPGELAAHVGTLMQDPETQVVMSTVRSELTFPLENHGFSAAQIARSVEEAAVALGIESILDRPTGELSGGELQRVALAAALATGPQLLVLDEPTSQLDPIAGDELLWRVKRLCEEHGTAVLLAEHKLDRCLAVVDRVAVLEAGHLVFDGRPQDFVSFARNAHPSLEPPAARLTRLVGVESPPISVRTARKLLLDAGFSQIQTDQAKAGSEDRDPGAECVAALEAIWCEPRSSKPILRDVNLKLGRGERIALLGSNGAGKSTLLRHLAGIDQPSRGKVKVDGRVSLLMQNPGDYLIGKSATAGIDQRWLARLCLEHLGTHDRRDLSGGQRQRLALAQVLSAAEADGTEPAVLALDEPTRGASHSDRDLLGSIIDQFASGGTAVVVATHDLEFAAAFADRVVLLAAGQVVAVARPGELLSGGWHFSTETARILGGLDSALLPEQGAKALLKHRQHEVVG